MGKTYRNGGDTPVPQTKDSDFSPYDLNKDGTVSDKEAAYAKKMKSFKAGKGARDAKASKAEATEKQYPTKSSKQLANSKAAAKGKPQPFPSVGTGDYSGTGGS